MVITVVHGPANHSAADTAVVQSLEITEQAEVDKTLGLVSGVTQVVKAVSHTKTNKFSVTGKGAITLAVGIGGTHNLALITGGLVHIGSVKLSQKLGTSSEWTYEGEHFPSAA